MGFQRSNSIMSDHGEQGWTSTIKTHPWTTNFLIVKMIVFCNRICGIACDGGRTPSSMGAILKLVAAIAVVVIGVQTVRVSGKITNPIFLLLTAKPQLARLCMRIHGSRHL
ncbi:uncharacterized protein LOC115924247 [Strongylocentrotus purpuratus]|uniref:Uncharacterized protein n=1 Tax=Strongylocentrotus purpuratus TaxID=7668 RepID=A0A7M7NVK2_STRPU|nr:uncharacterized protein LOC115924247 [Strongylocentrotus purpuratus]